MYQFFTFKKLIPFSFFLLLLSCQNDDNSDSNIYSNFQYQIDNVSQPVNDFHGFLDTDSTFVISSFSTKIPLKGLEDQIEDIYTKQNLSITLKKFKEGNYSFSGEQVSLQMDTLFYSHSSTPYRIGSLIPEFDSVNTESFLYIKEIVSGRNLITGNFNVSRLYDIIALPVDSNVKYIISGDFINLPFTKK